jgi:hypothetical protein
MLIDQKYEKESESIYENMLNTEKELQDSLNALNKKGIYMSPFTGRAYVNKYEDSKLLVFIFRIFHKKLILKTISLMNKLKSIQREYSLHLKKEKKPFIHYKTKRRRV